MEVNALFICVNNMTYESSVFVFKNESELEEVMNLMNEMNEHTIKWDGCHGPATYFIIWIAVTENKVDNEFIDTIKTEFYQIPMVPIRRIMVQNFPDIQFIHVPVNFHHVIFR